MAIALKEGMFEFSAVNTEITAVARWHSGYFTLYSLNDVWLWPWKYKKVQLNIDKVFLPRDTAYCITDTDEYTKEIINVKNVFGCDSFPTSVEVKSGKIIPTKIPKGYPIVRVMFFPMVKPHLYNLDFPQESI